MKLKAMFLTSLLCLSATAMARNGIVEPSGGSADPALTMAQAEPGQIAARGKAGKPAIKTGARHRSRGHRARAHGEAPKA